MKTTITMQRLFALCGFVLCFAVASRLIEINPWRTIHDWMDDSIQIRLTYKCYAWAAVAGLTILMAGSRRWRYLFLLILPLLAGAAILAKKSYRQLGFLCSQQHDDLFLYVVWFTLCLLCCIGIAGSGWMNTVSNPVRRRRIGGMTGLLLVSGVLLLSGFIVYNLTNLRLRVFNSAYDHNWIAVRQLVGRQPELTRTTDAFNTSLLYLAAQEGNRDTAKFLIENGAAVNPDIRSYRTPLYAACRKGHIEVVRLLLAHGANAKSSGKPFYTPLQTAASSGHIEIVHLLLQAGADVNEKDEYDFTPLHRAAQAGSREVAELLIARGADVNAKEKDGTTPLFWAKTPAVAQVLLDHGTDINLTAKDGITPFYHAAVWGSLEVAAFLLAHGSDVNVKCGILAETALQYVTAVSDTRRIRFLLKAGADINATDELGRTALHGAEKPEIIRQLLTAGSKLEQNSTNAFGTPLNEAAGAGNLESVKELIAQGANANSKTEGGYTPLHSVTMGSIDKEKFGAIADLLIKAGADIDAKTNKGETPLAMAIKYHNKELIEILRKHGAKE